MNENMKRNHKDIEWKLLFFEIPVFFTHPVFIIWLFSSREEYKYVVKHKSAKLLMAYAVGKLEAALNISHLILSTSSQRVS